MPQKYGEKPPIPWWTGGVIFFMLSAILVVFSHAAITLLMMFASDEATLGGMTTPIGMVIQVALISTLFGGVALLVPKLAEVPIGQWLHLSPAAVGVFGFSLLGVAGLGFLVDELTFVLHQFAPNYFSSDGLNAFSHIFQNTPPIMFVILTLTVSVGPGLGEELLFRGLILRSFLSGMPVTVAVLLSSILFGAIHLNALQGMGAGTIGLYLGFVAYRTGSLWPAVAAHAFNNFICALFAKYGGDMSTVWKTGHPLWIIVVAAGVFVIAVVGILSMTRPASKSASPGSQ